MPTLVSKPLSFFKEDPTNLRKSYDIEELRLLAASLTKKQLVPLICRPCGTIADGHRRYRSAMISGQPDHLDTIIVDANASPAQIKEIQLITALHHAGLKPYEQFCGFQAWLKAHPGATAKDLASAIDRSEAAVSMALSLSRCIKPVQEAAAAGAIGVKDWHIMSQASEEQQAVMLAAKLNGGTRDDLVRMVKRAKNGDKPTVRLSRFKYPLPSGVEITVAGKELSITDLIEALGCLIQEAKKASLQGLDIKTLVAVAKDKSRKGV